MRDELLSQLQTEQELRKALTEGQFTLAYQPILNSSTSPSPAARR
jgi:EAL domain-containing protein (putative c-di-GMP-specific phosphodiesterase class I)